MILNGLIYNAGAVLTYLAKLPMLGDAHGVRLAYLTSLLEVLKLIYLLEECLMYTASMTRLKVMYHWEGTQQLLLYIIYYSYSQFPMVSE